MVLLALPPGGSSSERKRSRPNRPFSAMPNDGQCLCRALAEDPGRTQPELRIPGAAAQTRVVSVAEIRLGSWESARPFKRIICDDISEFESSHPSHAVGSLSVRSLPANLAFIPWPMGCRLCAAVARTRLDRGSYYRDRVSLGGGTLRPRSRHRGRVRPAQCRCHCNIGDCGNRGCHAGDVTHGSAFVALDRSKFALAPLMSSRRR